MTSATHMMRLHNASTGTHWELTLFEQDGEWNASYCEKASNGLSLAGRAGSARDEDALRAFRRAIEAIEAFDEDVVGCDWAFESPLPPWMHD